MKICLVSSAGGHFTQILKVADFLNEKNYSYFFITHKAYHIEKIKNIFFITDPKRNILRFIKACIETFIILKENIPDVIISTGAGTVLPTCILGKFLFGAKLIHIESLSRVYKPSFTGKILYRFTDLFLTQWNNIEKYGKRAIYGGPLL